MLESMLEEQRKMPRMQSLSPPSDQLSSSSSISNASQSTDSDSLRLIGARPLPVDKNCNLMSQAAAPGAKSPILIKYNYYDYTGARQEQTHEDMNFMGHSQAQQQQQRPPKPAKIQRQLSPMFKQSLDQIVKKGQQLVERRREWPAAGSGSGSGSGSPASSRRSSPDSASAASSASASPTSEQPAAAAGELRTLHRRYKLSLYEQRCLRCNKTVYQMDKVGPLKEFTFYHQNCFKCRECGTKLTLKTYFNNQQSSEDQEVYCHNHCPKTCPGRLDNQSVGIRAALNAPKVFEALASAGAHQQVVADFSSSSSGGGGGAGAFGRAHLLRAGGGGGARAWPPGAEPPGADNKKLSQLISRRLEFLEPKQKLLEMRHREEEDALFREFELKWLQEESCISEQIRQEWQRELAKLLDRYKRQLSSISLANHQKARALPNGQQPATAAPSQPQELAADAASGGGGGARQQMIELERLNLEKSMTIKLDRKKETLKRKLKEFERQATAELVEKQSREMLALISIKLDEYKEEQKRKIGAEREQFEALDQLASELNSSLQLMGASGAPLAASSGKPRQPQPQAPAQARLQLQLAPPAPKPPKVSKMELYNNAEPDEVFRHIDEVAINVAREDQQTFTDLVHHLTRHCLSDVEKVRSIFRWITVKNLNTMHFDASVKPDTPLGLLRGIKNGSESYHVLFKRLCSYAGLHCVVIKGYSKSAGYQPGVTFEGNRFRNSWNAVFVAGAWRFVQCNWGARHLVSVAVMQDKSQAASQQQQQQPPQSPEVAGMQPQTRLVAASPNHGRRGHAVSLGNRLAPAGASPLGVHAHTPACSSPGHSSSGSSASSPAASCLGARLSAAGSAPVRNSQNGAAAAAAAAAAADSLRYEYDDHYFLTDPEEFIYEFHPSSPEWQLIKTRPISLDEFVQLPFVRSLFFKYGLYFPQPDIRSVLYADTSGAATVKIGMPTHMIPSLIFHYNLKYYNSDCEHYDGVSLKRFVMQSIESGTCETLDGQTLLSNITSFRVHLPENGVYILDIFANSTTPSQYITGEPMKFKSVCKFKIVAKNLKTVMIPLPDCASGEFGPMKATRLFGIIPITHENALIVVQNDKRLLEIQFRMTRPLFDFMASLHKNGYDEKQLSKSIKIFIEGDIVYVTVKFSEDGQYGLDLYTRDKLNPIPDSAKLMAAQSHLLSHKNNNNNRLDETQVSDNQPVAVVAANNKRPLLTHCCKYLINVRSHR